MLLGALVGAGVPFSLLEETTAALNIGARLEMRKVSRGGLAGTKVDVLIGDDLHDVGSISLSLPPGGTSNCPSRRPIRHSCSL